MDSLKITNVIDSLQQTSIKYVYWGIFRIRLPRFWYDPQRIIKLNLVMQLIIVLCWVLIAFMYTLRLLDFDILMHWDFYTMDVDGAINILQTKKL